MKAGDLPCRRFLPILALLAAAFPATVSSARAQDADPGAGLYEDVCGGCHAMDADRIGPRHRGVVGRRAGSISGFPYSSALAKSHVVWTPQALDRWLSDPEAVVPGQRMNFRVGDPTVRSAIIGYLARQRPVR